jgi:hypothetical protein
MLIAGAILLAIALGAVLLARSESGRARRATATETLDCSDITSLAAGVGEEVGGGSFRQQCEVVGTAEPGPQGALRAPESGGDVVWHRTKVTHRYWAMETRTVDGKTTRERVERSETVSDDTSSAPFAVRDASGTIAVDPRGAEVDAPERVVDRFEQGGQAAERGGFLAGLLRSGADSGTIGFRREEWVLRPGARLWIHGEVADALGTPTFGKPAKGDYIISTRSEAEVVGDARATAKFANVVAIIAGIAGVALLVAGLVT